MIVFKVFSSYIPCSVIRYTHLIPFFMTPSNFLLKKRSSPASSFCLLDFDASVVYNFGHYGFPLLERNEKAHDKTK